MNYEKELIETALRNHGHSVSVSRVISMEAESALPKGENYLSTIYRITLKVVLGNGRTAKKSLILKVVPPEKAKTELVMSMGVFKSETIMYTVILREMEALMEEFGDTNDVLWCKLLHYEPYTSLLMEDLKASGFKMTRRQDCLDLDHSLLVLRSLGRFHGMAKILEQRGIINRTDYKPYPLTNDKNLIKFFMYYGLQTLSKAMEDSWGPEWYDVAQKLKIPCDVLTEKMIKLGEIDDSRFNCLNHGDCWSNNMMFKYDWQNRPYTMRFLDLQLVHYNSPVMDLLYFMFVSVDADVRRNKQKVILETYSDSLNSTLEFYGFEGTKPELGSLEADLDYFYLFSIFSFVFIHAVIATEYENGYDLETVISSQGTAGISTAIYDDVFRKRNGEEIKIFAEKIDCLLRES